VVNSVTELSDEELESVIKAPRGKVIVRELEADEQSSAGVLLPEDQIERSMICRLIAVGKPQVFAGKEFPFAGGGAKPGDLLICRQYDGLDVVPWNWYRSIDFPLVEALYKPQGLLAARLIPLSDRILIKKDPETEEIDGFQIGPESDDPPASGTVIAVGPGRILHNGSGRKPIGPAHRSLIPGDRIGFRPYSGCRVEIGGEELHLIPEVDLCGVVKINPAWLGSINVNPADEITENWEKKEPLNLNIYFDPAGIPPQDFRLNDQPGPWALIRNTPGLP